ncbi:hypothetical protein Fmac_015378 [Flemingia macrophylla]|uniref:START domain-containing protein n=1 Tax=Flemingia macrophylla TaxID=520843 RepID=A0ABD1MEE8_9FABA
MPRTLHFPPRLLTPSRDLIERHQWRHRPLASPFTSSLSSTSPPPIHYPSSPFTPIATATLSVTPIATTTATATAHNLGRFTYPLTSPSSMFPSPSQETPVKRCRDVNEDRRSGLTVFGNDYETHDGTGFGFMAEMINLALSRLQKSSKIGLRGFVIAEKFVDVSNVLPTANGGTIELLYMQLYAPTTLAPARDFWLLRYTSVLEDGSLVICERSLKNTQNGPSMPLVQHFVRAEMLPSGYLIRPCEGGDSIIHIIDHMDLESNVTGWGRRPAALRALSQRLSHGFNEAINGFTDEGWSIIGNDGVDDVTVLVNSSPDKLMGLNISFANGFPAVNHSTKFMEVIKLEGIDDSPEDTIMPREVFLLQEASNPNRTLDLASTLDVGTTGNRASNDYFGNSGCMRSVMTIAFEFAFENHMQEHVASMARQYVRSIISSVQRVALALSPSHLSSQAGLRTPLGTPEAQTLARWICNSYSIRRLEMEVEVQKWWKTRRGRSWSKASTLTPVLVAQPWKEKCYDDATPVLALQLQNGVFVEELAL